MLSLQNTDVAKIEAGNYIVMIDPIWDETTTNSQAYREIMIDVYCPTATKLCGVDKDFGWEIFRDALSHYARHLCPKELRIKYLADKEDYQKSKLAQLVAERLPEDLRSRAKRAQRLTPLRTKQSTLREGGKLTSKLHRGNKLENRTLAPSSKAARSRSNI